jgi:arabinofuranosyltransferase
VRASTIAIVAAVVYAAALLAFFPRITVDDAFITMRYAENLAFHGELTYNAGEDPVEGYTGIALPVVLAGLVRGGIPPVAAGRIVGVASFVTGAVLLWLLLGRLGTREWARATGTVFYLCAPFQPVHALAGLETSLWCSAIVASAYTLLRSLEAPEERRAREEIALWSTLLFAGLVRPEGVVLAASSALVLAYDRARRGGLAETAARFSFVYLVPAAIYFGWRWSYYGLPLPNTYYAKWAPRTYWDSVRGMAAFAAYYLATPAVAVAALLLRRSGAVGTVRSYVDELRATDRGRALWLIACGLFVVAVFYQYRRSALIMNYSHRFFAPFFPLFLAAFALVAGSARARAMRAVRVVLVLLAVVQMGLWGRASVSEAAFARATRDLIASEHVPVGLLVRERVPAGEWLAVVLDAGAIPYVSGLPTIDVGGLNDEFLGKRWYTRMEPGPVADYVFGRNPGAFVFTSTDWDRVEHPNAADFTNDPRFERYELAAKFRCDTVPDYFQFVFLRKDIVAGTTLADRSDPNSHAAIRGVAKAGP